MIIWKSLVWFWKFHFYGNFGSKHDEITNFGLDNTTQKEILNFSNVTLAYDT